MCGSPLCHRRSLCGRAVASGAEGRARPSSRSHGTGEAPLRVARLSFLACRAELLVAHRSWE
eukprot:12977164-Alexandrium_andersonii.AAC.1